MLRSSYKYDEFKKYQKINNYLPQSLVSLCYQDIASYFPDVSSFDEQLNEIISSITKGDNPNNIVFRNFVKFYVNKINQTTYLEYLEKLKALDYSSRENVQFLGTELIVCSLRCPISVKGFTFQEDNKYKSVPEICADIVKQFSTFVIKESSGDGMDINFKEELLKITRQFFFDFVDLTKSLDENNENTSDNYKGFMTFMGLLYSRGILNIKVVIDCMDMIKRTIFNTECKCDKHEATGTETVEHTCTEHTEKLQGSKKQLDSKISKSICYFDCNKCTPISETNILVTFRKHVECLNLHKGYEHLMTHVINSLDHRITDNLVNHKSKLDYINTISNYINDMKKEHIRDSLAVYISNKKISDYIMDYDDKEVTFGSIDNFYKLFGDKKAAMLRLNEILDDDLVIGKKNYETACTSLDKLCECLDTLIRSHQEFISLNQYYRSPNKNQLVAPFKPHVVITHNSIGASLNSLHSKLESVNTYKTVYISVAASFGSK
jgi:hypothetical protein